MDKNDPRLRELARLQIRLGAAVQKGQRLHIKGIPVSCAPYAEVLAEEAYRAGAANVEIFWKSAEIERLRLLHAEEAALEDWYGPDEAAWESFVRRGDCELVFFGTDPRAFDGCGAARIARAGTTGHRMMRPVTQAHCDGRIRVCTSALPTAAWAREVFPALSEAAALDALWEAVFAACRVTGDGKAEERWRVFAQRSERRCAWLESLALTELHYRSGLGTDVRIGLPEGCLWGSARERSQDGVSYFANLPTEEVYTSPHRDRAEGTIVSSLPLYWQGSVIEGIRLRMENGAVTEAHATRGEELLRELLATDEGALHLGECALVSWDSPIRRSGTAFRNMLFDENAACHFALGLGFAQAVSEDSAEKDAINHSQLHMDFMIGTADLHVTGTTADGREVTVFDHGCWAGGEE